MTELQLFSEPFGANGGIHGETTKSAIGRPALDPWDLFLRETLQNSWDARLDPAGPIGFAVDLVWMSSKQTEYLWDHVLTDTPPGMGFRDVREQEDIALLVVTDRGTRGLTGPTRADRSSSERTDFVDFIRNVGRGHGKQLGGGTYGLGKGVLTGSSSVSTILCYSRTTSQGRPVERFIAAGNGEDFEADGLKYTGRHWWGLRCGVANGPSVEPLTGTDARRAAEKLGMPIMPANETGTSIAVLAPTSFHGETCEEIVDQIALAATYWAWPHLIGDGESPTIRFSFSADGKPVAIQDPREDPVFSRYVEAYEIATRVDRESRSITADGMRSSGSIWSQKPILRLGGLGVKRYVRHTDLHPDIHSSVALMRNPRFVVSYMKVQPDPNGLSTAAVFIADEQSDAAFAKSEPVAHDDWQPQKLALEKGHANPVKIALDKIKASFKSGPASSDYSGASGTPRGVATLASRLGQLIDGLDGTDSSIPDDRDGKDNRSKGGSASPKKLRHGQPVNVSLTEESGVIVASFLFNVWAPDNTNVVLTAEPVIVVDGGTEEVDSGLRSSVRILRWQILGVGTLFGQNAECRLSGKSEVTVSVSQPRDVALTVKIFVKEAV